MTLAALLATDRTRWLGHAMAVDRRRLAHRAQRPRPGRLRRGAQPRAAHRPGLVAARRRGRLDADYLGVLPDDAIPALVAALPSLPAADAVRLRSMLRDRRGRAAEEPAYTSPFAWNLGRERARAALETLP